MSSPSIMLLTHLEQMRAEWKPKLLTRALHYAGPADFVLREGTLMPWRPLPPEAPAGQMARCYHNAIMFSLVNALPYVEGYAIHRSGIAFAHAWNLDERGRVLDITWDERRIEMPAWRAYMGVRFSAWRAHECTWHGDACVIDDFHRGWPLLAEAWDGEDSPGDLSELARTMRDVHHSYTTETGNRIAFETFVRRASREYMMLEAA